MKNRFLAVVGLGFFAVLSSCGERATSTGPAPTAIEASLNRGFHQRKHHRPPDLVRCRPQHPDIAVQRIGSSGGRIDVGPYSLTVPAGALSRRVFIVARIRSGESVNVVELQPDGLVFEKPALLSMTYSNCVVDDDDVLRIAHVDDNYRILSYLETTQGGSQRLLGQLEHFSNYAVAW
jgi:hypothetical protein